MLETWEALRFERINHSGRTKPLIIECAKVNPATARSDRCEFLVKALGLPEIWEQSLFCEVVGNWLARKLGVNTPAPALIKLESAFVGNANRVLQTERLVLQEGIGAGCEYIKGGFAGFGSLGAITFEEVAQAVSIYGFDILLQNPDRRHEKPNLGFLGNRLIAFDFESAFSFLLPVVGVSSEPWEVAKNSVGPRHILAKCLRNHEPDWKPLINALNQLNLAQLDALAELLPNTWQSYMPKVKAHLLNLQENSHRLEVELQRSLKA
jgi:hypothetical protein